MNSVQARITAFYHQMEQAQSQADKMIIKKARQDYYDNLSEEDQRVAREAANPFLEKLIKEIEREVDPMMEKFYAMMERRDALHATACTTESVARPAPRQ